MLHDIGLLVAFWGLVLAPCLMAMKTGLHRDEPYQSKEFEEA